MCMLVYRYHNLHAMTTDSELAAPGPFAPLCGLCDRRTPRCAGAGRVPRACEADPKPSGQYGLSQVVSPVFWLCQYSSPESSSTSSSHPGGSPAAGSSKAGGGGGSAGGLGMVSAPRGVSKLSSAGCSHVVSPVVWLYQYFCERGCAAEGVRLLDG